jgi:hypothetical protein
MPPNWALGVIVMVPLARAEIAAESWAESTDRTSAPEAIKATILSIVNGAAVRVSVAEPFIGMAGVRITPVAEMAALASV